MKIKYTKRGRPSKKTAKVKKLIEELIIDSCFKKANDIILAEYLAYGKVSNERIKEIMTQCGVFKENNATTRS